MILTELFKDDLWTNAVIILSLLITIDIVTGVAKSWINHELRSRAMREGLVRKVIVLPILFMTHLLDLVLFPGQNIFSNMTVIFYITNEALSIIENLAQMGVPVPNFIKEKLKVLKETSEKGDKQ
jgi:toxin secretion/phage lysis holin